MARPTIDPEGKRKQIGVRFGPQDRAALDALAADEGVSVGKLIENRTAALIGADQKTFALLVSIVEGIEQARNLMADPASAEPPQWHEDLTTWGAVAEMLASGPGALVRPETAYRDAGFIDAIQNKSRILVAKQKVIDRLSAYGIPATLQSTLEFPAARRRRGLFGTGLFALPTIDRRANERKLIDAIEDDDARAKALELHAELIALDEQEKDEGAFADDTVKIYRDMEDEGRAAWRKYRTDKLLADIMATRPFNPVELL